MIEDLIDISDVCFSPHKIPYESFLQIDRYRKGEKLDENIGLYGLLSQIFPVESTATDKNHFRLSLENYRIVFPDRIDSGSPESKFLFDLESLAWKYRNRGATLWCGIDLEIRASFQTGRDFVRQNKTGVLSSKKGTLLSYRFGSFPLFTPKGTFILNGLERVPIVQLKPNSNSNRDSDLKGLDAWVLSDHIAKIVRCNTEKYREFMINLLNKISSFETLSLNTLTEWFMKKYAGLFTGELCPILDDTNPLSEISMKRKVTTKRRGGKTRAYMPERRAVHASHYGRICLAETPESESIGMDLHLALAARIENKKILCPFLQDGKTVLWAPEEEMDFCFKPKADAIYERDISDRFLIRRSGNVDTISELPANVCQDKYAAQFLGLAANLIPFVQHNDNNRVMMGAKNMKQALPLLKPELPLVKTGREKLLGRLSGHAVFAGSPGYVKNVKEDQITVLRMDGGGEDIYGIQPEHPTAHRTITCHRVHPRIREGEEIEKGQVLADGACTVNGELALGVNLLVAYMPYKGLNFEDGIVISDRLVKDDVLTSLHIWDVSFKVYSDQLMESEDTKPELAEFTLQKGILCHVGQDVRKGDRLFVKYRLPGEESGTRFIEKDYFNSPVSGRVVNILHEPAGCDTDGDLKIQYRKRCWILEKRPVEVGDKLMGRHGNKGVISRIVPSEEMPCLEDGTPVDIILNPHGVVSRMNLGQIMETHLGWILHHGGKDFEHLGTVFPFQSITEETLKAAFRSLSHTGISETGKAVLTDGRNGKRFENPVTVGYQYIMKLNHLVSDKIHVRNTGRYHPMTLQPVKGQRLGGGQRVGEMEVWALEAHLARSVLVEMLTVKSDAPAPDRAVIDTTVSKPMEIDESIIPETLAAAVILLRGMGLDMILRDPQSREIPIGPEKPELVIHQAGIEFAGEESVLKWANDNMVTKSGGPRFNGNELTVPPDSLYDRKIFLNQRYDMGCIQLPAPVIHPLLVKTVQERSFCIFKDHFREILGDAAIPNVITDSDISKIKKEFKEVMAAKKIIVRNDRRIEFASIEELPDIPSESAIWDRFDLLDTLVSYTDSKSDFSRLLGMARMRFVPVLPLDFRPLSVRQGNKLISSPINYFYHQILSACSELEKVVAGDEPLNRRLLRQLRIQEAVNRLMMGDKITTEKRQMPIADMIRGKEGIFRKFLLGKRVDFSGRSVIVPMPELDFGTAGIPLGIAVGLTRDVLIDRLMKEHGEDSDPHDREQKVRHILANPEVISHRYLIEKKLMRENGILKKRVLILNRAPSLHKYNLISFKPVLTKHQAIGLHPLLCKMFNADFDGDQMAVHLPVSAESIAEADQYMAPEANILSVADGKPMLNFSQDIVLGLYHLSRKESGRSQIAEWFDCPFEPDENLTAAKLEKMLLTYFSKNPDVVKRKALLQKLMNAGFAEATLSGLTFSVFDTPYVPFDERCRLHGLGGGVKELEETVRNFLEEQMKGSDSPVAMMVQSGARGGMTQIVQLGGLRGVMTDMMGRAIETPVCRNYREGVSPLEFFIGSHASRRSMCEKKLITAEAGAFTRKLVEAAYRFVIQEEDCGNHEEGVLLHPVPMDVQKELGYKIQFADRLTGRVLADGRVIDASLAQELAVTDQPVTVRSVVTCRSAAKHGYGALCRHCYGWDLSTGRFPEIGSPVGIIAGQSIGERGTQLTMQTFHTCGVGAGEVTGGLSRIRKFFNDRPIDLENYRVTDPGNSGLKVDSIIDLWQWAFCKTRFPELKVIRNVENADHQHEGEKPDKKNLSSNMERGMDALLLILHIESSRTYKGAIHDRHFEVILRSMFHPNDTNPNELQGISKVPFNQPGFLAAASYQSALKVLTLAALEKRMDNLEGYKEKIIMGKKI